MLANFALAQVLRGDQFEVFDSCCLYVLEGFDLLFVLENAVAEEAGVLFWLCLCFNFVLGFPLARLVGRQFPGLFLLSLFLDVGQFYFDYLLGLGFGLHWFGIELALLHEVLRLFAFALARHARLVGRTHS